MAITISKTFPGKTTDPCLGVMTGDRGKKRDKGKVNGGEERILGRWDICAVVNFSLKIPGLHVPKMIYYVLSVKLYSLTLNSMHSKMNEVL